VGESSLQVPELRGLRLYVYRRPLHPELFRIFLQQKVTMSRYEADLLVLALGHVVCFHAAGSTITELVVTESDLFSQKGLVEKLTVARPHEYEFHLDQTIHYLVSTQAEQMSQAVFEREYGQMVAYGRKHGLFMQFRQWPEHEGMSPFSLVDYDRRPGELCLSAYHTFPARKLMLKIQSVFSLEHITDPGRQSGRTSGGPRG